MRPFIAVLLLAFVGAATAHAEDTREHWLSPKDLVGDSFQARCLGMSGAGAIDLTPYGVELFWCASDTLPADMTGVVTLGKADDILGAKKAQLVTTLKQPITAATVGDLLIEFVTPLIRAGRDGKLKIYLGRRTPEYQQTAGIPFRDYGLVADLANAAAAALTPSPAWATVLAIDIFPTDGNLDGSTQVYSWTEFNGTVCTVSSNAVAASTAATCEARADVDLATDDMDVSATVTGAADVAGEVRIGVIGRKANDTTRTFMAGHAVFDQSPANAEWRLIKRVAGAATTLGTNSTDPVNGDVVRLHSDGSSHSVYVNNAEFIAPVTDSAVSGNTRAGLMYIGSHASDSATLDNWHAYDYPLPRRGGTLWFQ